MTAWTTERVEALRQLWADGLSCTQIATRLGGTTRNAVIGKSIRLGLPRRARSIPRTLLSTNRSRPTAPTAMPLPLPEISDVARVSFAELAAHHCRWSVGDPATAGSSRPLFCGLSRAPGLPYCDGHAARAYATPAPRAAPAPAREMEAAA